MKKTALVAYLFFLCINTFAQDSDAIAKKLCRIWIPDKKGIGEIEKNLLFRNFDGNIVYLFFQEKEGILYVGTQENAEIAYWAYQPTLNRVTSSKANFYIKEITTKKFSFTFENGENEVVIQFVSPTKAEAKKIQKLMASNPPRYPPPAIDIEGN